MMPPAALLPHPPPPPRRPPQAALFYPTFLLHILICALRPLLFLLRVHYLAPTTGPLVDGEANLDPAKAAAEAAAAATVEEGGCGGGSGGNGGPSASPNLTADLFYFTHNAGRAERAEQEGPLVAVISNGDDGGNGAESRGAAVRSGEGDGAALLAHAV